MGKSERNETGTERDSWKDKANNNNIGPRIAQGYKIAY